MNVGFIGLGTMGAPMARNILKRGHRLVVADVVGASVDALVREGASRGSTPREVAATSDIVITMLPDAPDVERVALGDDGVVAGLRAGAVYIDMSTIDPQTTRRVGKAVADRGASMIDSPVGKTADAAVAGTLTLMVGGPADIVARCRPVLDCMGTDFFHCGELGAGQTMKLINNLLATAVSEASIEALVTGRKSGLALDTMMSVLRTTMAWNNALAIALPKRPLAGDFKPGFMMKLAHKDCRLALAMVESLGVSAPVGRAAFESVDEALHKGLADDDVGALLKLREESAGVQVRAPRRDPRRGQSMSYDPAARRRIGRGPAFVSQLGVGTAPFGSMAAEDRDDTVAAAFQALYSAGLRYYDTAPFYGLGLAEHRLGAGLRSIDRRSVTVSTKVGRLLQPVAGGTAPGPGSGKSAFEVAYDYSYDGTMRSLEHSLARLGTNAVDIVLIHDVNRRWQGDLVEQRYGEAMSGAYRALTAMREQGVIQAIGVGVNDWSILLRFAADGDFDCFMLAGRYTLLDHTSLETFMPDCERRGISVLMAAPFNSGILATGARPGATYFYQDAEPEILIRTQRIEAVCARHGVALAAAALQFPLAHPAVASVVTGMRNVAEARANLDHCAARIPVEFWQELRHEGLVAAAAPLPSEA